MIIAQLEAGSAIRCALFADLAQPSPIADGVAEIRVVVFLWRHLSGPLANIQGDPAIAAKPGKLVVARWDGSPQATFRQLLEESGQLYLVPLNPTYPKQLLTDDCRLLGVVVQATAKF